MRDRLFLKANGIILILFIFISIFFIFSIKNHSYLGIRVKKNGDEWVIKKVQPGGTASTMNLKNGDKIITIDNRKPEDNSTVEKWLIVESVSEMEIVRNGKNHRITFCNEQNILSKQLLFTGIGLICLSILFLLPTFSGISTTWI
ncbi:PDZ domain-containing protein [Candidatus Enterococcus murrayae]|uniref:PDZ domain-containing protein n=1 Tax=Candidatus Enterococcus murrayae TaxID=2815321 RepID=A0ABS3HPP0_9ENTE|nr:PDZ domain-containing protein [Enterococcus sp. MJM16]MBO0454904.1 PDZ domain-containing protein [Enterococcus sp. MJM16]